MAQDQERDGLVSFRNLEEGFTQPLLEFTGRFDGFRTEYNEQYKTTYVYLNFTDVEVIASTEPYDLPIFTFRVPLNKRIGTTWGILSKSAVGLLGEAGDIRDLIGATLHLKRNEHSLWDGGVKAMVSRQVWEIIGMEGSPQPAEKVDALTRVLEILDGKTGVEFGSEAVTDPLIRGDATVNSAIISKSLIPTLIAKGAVTVDENGIHHVVKE